MSDREQSDGLEITFVDEPAAPARSADATYRIAANLGAMIRAFEHGARSAAQLREMGGVLIGRHGTDLTDDGLPTVRIEEAIPADGASEGEATIHFTAEAWEAIYREIDERGLDGVVVGWYHTHPGFGAFYSPVDEASHERYFSNPWQVGLVIDPCRMTPDGVPEHVFFRWIEGAVSRNDPLDSTGYWIVRSEDELAVAADAWRSGWAASITPQPPLGEGEAPAEPPIRPTDDAERDVPPVTEPVQSAALAGARISRRRYRAEDGSEYVLVPTLGTCILAMRTIWRALETRLNEIVPPVCDDDAGDANRR